VIKEQKPTVFVVDDDAAVRDSLRLLLKSVGLPVEVFESAQDFLDAERDDRPVPSDLRSLPKNELENLRSLGYIK